MNMLRYFFSFILFFAFNFTTVKSQNNTTYLYFYRQAKAFSNSFKYKIYLNDVNVGELSNNSKLTCKINSGGKLVINLSAYISNTRESDFDISRTIFVSAGEIRYFSLIYDDLWMLKDVEKRTAISEFNKCKKHIRFEENSNKQIFNNEEKGFIKISDNKNPDIVFTNNKLNFVGSCISTTKDFTLYGSIKDDSDITDFTINDKPFKLNNSNFKIKINLSESVNNFVIKATDEFSNVATKNIKITYKKQSSLVSNNVTNSNNSNLNSSLIKWNFPTTASSLTNKNKYNIKVCVKQNKKIEKVDIIVNSKLQNNYYFEGQNDTKDCRFLINESIDLSFGTNIINIRCYTNTKSIESKRFITYKPPAYNYHALIIGVEDYTDNQINDLANPVSDAKKLYNVLTTKYTFAKENISLLLNPSKAEIIGTLHNLRTSIGKDDNLLIFYAGHGY